MEGGGEMFFIPFLKMENPLKKGHVTTTIPSLVETEIGRLEENKSRLK